MSDDKKKDDDLDQGLQDTFPASDPVNVGDKTEPDRPVERRPPAIDHDLVDRLAEEVRKKQSDLESN